VHVDTTRHDCSCKGYREKATKVRFTDFGLIINTVLEIINNEEHKLKEDPLKMTRKKSFSVPKPPSRAQFWKISE